MKHMYAKITFRSLLLSFLALLLIGCGQQGSPGGVGPGMTAAIQMSAATTTVPADGVSSTAISAQLSDSVGSGVTQYTSVTFTTNLGTFLNGKQKIEMMTPDTSGMVQVSLISPKTGGTANIIATSNNVTQQVSIEFVKALPPVTITVSARPNTVRPLGTTTITARVKDAVDDAVVGETVTFYVLSNISGGSLQSLTVLTNVNGEASVTYTAGSDIGQDVIQATASSNGINGTTTVKVDAQAIVVGGINVIAGSSTLVADGASQTLIRATVTDVNGDAAAGKTVNFTTTAGTLSAASQITNSQGIAEVKLTSSTITGTTTVRAECDGFINETPVEFVAGQAAKVLVSAVPDTVNPNDTVNLSAIVMDANDNRLSNVRVRFILRKAGISDILDTAEVVSNDQGVATSSLIAAYGEGDFEITAETNNGKSGTATFTVSAAAIVVRSVSIEAGTQSMPADGTTQTVIRATVFDKNNNPIPGALVTFTTTIGTLSASSDLTDTSGIASVMLTSATKAGTATITADCHGVKATVPIQFVGGQGKNISVQIIPASIKPGNSATVIATLTDANGNPLGGMQLDFVISQNNTGGNVSPVSQSTSDNGQAIVVYTAGATEGTDQIKATLHSDETVYSLATINVVAGPTGSITVTAGTDSMIANGTSQTLLRAVVLNTESKPAQNVAVYFSTTAGNVTNLAIMTDGNGIANTILTAPKTVGTATVTATSSGISNTTQVNFIPGPPASINISATPASLTADGASTSTVNMIVLDANNNPVNGETLVLSATTGTLNVLSVVMQGGMASATYTSPTSVPALGYAEVTATTTNNVTNSIKITLTGTIVANITLSAYPASIPADGHTQATITATLTSVGGGSVPDGTAVTFEIVSGGGGGTLNPTTATTASGKAITFLMSSTTPGITTVRATAGSPSRTAELNVAFTAGSVGLTIIPNSILGTGAATSKITATVLTVSGTPDPARTVTITLNDLSLGTILTTLPWTNPAPTDASGEAVFMFQGKQKGGTVTVTATTDTGLIATGSIEILPPPAFIQVSSGYPKPTNINIRGTGGQSTSIIVFDVKDLSGNSVADGYRVDFTILDGPNGGEAIDPSSGVTTGGKVSTILRSGSKSGPVSIKATYYYNSSVFTVTASITISAGPPVGEEFGVFAQYLNISGLINANLQDGITVNVGDIYGNAVPDGTAISFKTYNTGGLFTTSTANTASGLATGTLISTGTQAAAQGFLTVTAEANNGGRTTHVRSIAVTPDVNHKNIIYVGTDGGGVYKSTDSGASWQNVSRSSSQGQEGQNYIDPFVNSVCVDPDDWNTVYAATGYLGRGNIYRSNDGGITWLGGDFEKWSGVLSVDNAVLSVLCDNAGSDYVWAGTDGLGAVFARDGVTFGWGGIVSVPSCAGSGCGGGASLTGIYEGDALPELSVTSKTETWTAIYAQTAGIVRNLTFTPFGTSQANGTVSPLTASSTAGNETWKLEYQGGFSAITETVGGADFEATIDSIGAGTLSETWTVTCIDIGTAGSEKWSVVGTVSGLLSSATTGVEYTAGSGTSTKVKFHILSTGSIALGDQFTFTTTADSWKVTEGATVLATPAKTNTSYTSANGAVTFTITIGSVFYAMGDKFEFDTIPTGEWVVKGSVSGTQTKRAQTDVPYTSANGEVRFMINSGTNTYLPGDKWTFNVTESGLGYGKIVRDIVKVPGTNGSTATLYAATAYGVYKSTNGGTLWSPTTRFAGDNINCLAIHPTVAGVVYAGTEDAAVRYTTNGGTTWNSMWASGPPVTNNNGLGKGLSASTPVPAINNAGNGVMSAVTVQKNTQTENWTVQCTLAAPNAGTFSITGSVSGLIGTYNILTHTFNPATIPTDIMDFTISDGSIDFAAGDIFTFRTTRDPATKIKDLLVDAVNNRLYAATYFSGELEPHAVGDIYFIAIDGSGAPTGSWTEANSGLPQFDPPDDLTLFPQHALAVDNPASPAIMYAGGEGINFSKATTGLTTNTPTWVDSKTGLTNRIMARMPILFTDTCTMSVSGDVTAVDTNTNNYTYTVYVEDKNGNPPIVGSTVTVVYKPKTGTAATLLTVTYPDAYIYQGTWRDPTDPTTNNPYIIRLNNITTGSGDQLILTFTPTCDTTKSPGCSGGTQIQTITY